ncbi:M20 family metallopeptidase [Halovivax sp.]|uniref:M20 family metallopeptidase n=1 Tax=Halovivax sp. TaxID=1935978 RepID=UPI0025BB51B6|nr:M20 family metallopeptidase [Halovivax sp.]
MTAHTTGPADPAFDPIDFLEAAVATPSHEDVGQMRDLLVETLEDRGVDVRVDDAGNVIAAKGAGSGSVDGAGAGEGADGGTHLLLNTHVDTVTPHVPLERREGGDLLCGRGACDAKGPLAAMLSAYFAVDPGAGRLTLAVTPDEETLSTGAHALVSTFDSPVRDADGVIVGEPTGLDVCTAAKGRFQGTVELSGAHAHAAEPDSGSNAVAALERVLRAVRTFDDRPDGPGAHPDLGETTLTPTVVRGGEATNQVPDACRLTLDRRSVPPETADSFRTALVEHLRARVSDPVDVDFAFADRPTPFLEAWATDAEEPLVRTLVDASGGDVRSFDAATEASYFAAHAPTVVFGPGVLADAEGAVAHSPREYVEVADVREAADALEAAISDVGV